MSAPTVVLGDTPAMGAPTLGASASMLGERDASTPPTLVELVGLPGSGKSTVVREALQRLRAAGLRVEDDDLPPVALVARLRRYGRFALFCASHPRLVRAVVRYTAAVRPWSAERLPFAHGVLAHAFGAVDCRRRHVDVVLVSQGALQAAWSVAVRGAPPKTSVVQELIAELLRVAGGVAVVHVDLDPAQAAERIAFRGTRESRFDQMVPLEAKALLPELARHLATMTDMVRARLGDAFLRVDGRLPSLDNGSAVAGFIHARRAALAPPRALDATDAPAQEGTLGRVALFVPSLEIGGAERVIANLGGEFVRRGFAVDLLLVHRMGIYLDEVSPDVRIIDLKARRTLLAIPGLVRYLRRERPDVMLATLTYANIAAIVARRLARVATRVVVREANTLTREAEGATELKDRQLPRMARWFYPWADAIVAVSAGAADNLVEATHTPRSRVHVLDNPIVTPSLPRLAAEPVDHAWFTSDAGQPVVVAAGRFTAQKDFPTLLRAFAVVRARRQVRLLILGDGELRASLEQLARDLGIADDVSLPGVMRNPFAYMARAAVFVLSSAWEGSPGVLIQAMASGAPVVATDCESGPREILRGGEFGPLVRVGDVAGLAAAIEGVLAAPRRSPPERAWRRFALETSVAAYLQVLGLC